MTFIGEIDVHALMVFFVFIVAILKVVALAINFHTN